MLWGRACISAAEQANAVREPVHPIRVQRCISCCNMSQLCRSALQQPPLTAGQGLRVEALAGACAGAAVRGVGRGGAERGAARAAATDLGLPPLLACLLRRGPPVRHGLFGVIFQSRACILVVTLLQRLVATRYGRPAPCWWMTNWDAFGGILAMSVQDNSAALSLDVLFPARPVMVCIRVCRAWHVAMLAREGPPCPAQLCGGVRRDGSGGARCHLQGAAQPQPGVGGLLGAAAVARGGRPGGPLARCPARAPPALHHLQARLAVSSGEVPPASSLPLPFPAEGSVKPPPDQIQQLTAQHAPGADPGPVGWAACVIVFRGCPGRTSSQDAAVAERPQYSRSRAALGLQESRGRAAVEPRWSRSRAAVEPQGSRKRAAVEPW